MVISFTQQQTYKNLTSIVYLALNSAERLHIVQTCWNTVSVLIEFHRCTVHADAALVIT